MAVGVAGLNLEQQDQLWDMWRGGASIRGIERSLRLSKPRIQRFLRQTGGIRPQPRRRREGHLSAAEREEVSRGLAAGLSGRDIAARLGRSPSTVAREITRNGGRDAYRAVDADAAAFDRARRPKPSKLARDLALRKQVTALLAEDWSPQQIAATLLLQHPDEPRARVSHETIYRDLYTPTRQVFAADTFHRLRSGRPVRRPRGKTASHGRGRIRNMVSVHARPAEADTRKVAGHWEGDLVFGARPSAVATLVDRATRYTIVVALPNDYKADTVAAAIVERMGMLPAHLRRSLTWDRGREMASHATITAALSMPVFFCDPHHPWQRGTNENTNRLLRQYLHKQADLSTFTQQDVDFIAAKLNHRPRRVLGWATPVTAFGPVEKKHQPSQLALN